MSARVRTGLAFVLIVVIAIGGIMAAITQVRSSPASVSSSAVDIELIWTGDGQTKGLQGMPVECEVINHKADSWVRVELTWTEPGVVVGEANNGWILGDDGLYYLTYPLRQGESVPFELLGETELAGTEIVAKVKAQAIQAAHVEMDFSQGLPWEGVTGAFSESTVSAD